MFEYDADGRSGSCGSVTVLDELASAQQRSLTLNLFTLTYYTQCDVATARKVEVLLQQLVASDGSMPCPVDELNVEQICFR